MTEFRTKGKGNDRQVYPIRKKQPFGVPRKLAYEEVMALRKGGKKARLIKTNQRLDLYAPYEAIIPGDSSDRPENESENRKFSSYEEIERALGMSRSDAQAWADVHPDLLTGPLRDEVEMFSGMKPSVNDSSNGSGKNKSEVRDVNNGDRVNVRDILGIDSRNGKINLNSDDLSNFYGKGSTIKATVQDGQLTFLSVDPAHIAMIRETMESHLPNGYLDPVSYGKDFAAEWTNSLPAGAGNVRWPSVDYGTNSWTVRLEGKTLGTFLKFLGKNRDDTVAFILGGDSRKAYVAIDRRYEDSDSTRTKLDLVEDVRAVSTKPPSDAPSGFDTSEKVILSREYLASTVRTMLGRSSFQHPRDQVLTMRLKSDYPIELSTRRIGPGGEHVQVDGIIAPRMES